MVTPSSSSEGMSSPFFQKQDTMAKITKRKTHDEGHCPSKKHNVREQLPKDQRCGRCFKDKQRCFGLPPFKIRCSTCEKYRRTCLPQGVNRQVYEGLPKEQRCQTCFQDRRRCFGTPPFTIRCSACEQCGRTCLPQGVKKQQVDEGLPKEQRCQTCFRQSRRCVGTPPFNTSCRACIKRGRPCKPQDTELNRKRQLMEKRDKCIRCASMNARCDGGIPCSVCINRGYNCSNEKTKRRLPKDQCCNSCNGRRSRCDGERPCNKCRKANTQCRRTIGKETWIYRPDPSKWPKPTRMDYCAQCRYRTPLYFGGPPMQCNGRFPCNCCLQQSFGVVRCACTYHLGNGISKLFRLDDDTAANVRDRKARKRPARTKKSEDSKDKESIDDDIIVSQNDQKANSNDDDNMEKKGTDGRTLDDNFDLYLPEDAEQAGETDQNRSSEGGADDMDHEDFLHDSDQSPMEIDSDDAVFQIRQRQVRGSLGAANDVNESLDQIGRPQELKPIPTNRKSSSKTNMLHRSRPITLLTKSRNIRPENTNARVMALTKRTSTRQRPWKIAKHA